MAVIDLKNEKRINVNGEWDKITTHPNNEPIFRQNGYQLELKETNSDYVSIPSPTYTTFGNVKFDIDVYIDFNDSTTINQRSIFFQGFRTFQNEVLTFWIGTGNGRLNYKLTKTDNSDIFFGSVDIGLTNEFNGRLKLENGLVFYNGLQILDLSINNSEDVSFLNSYDIQFSRFVDGAGATKFGNPTQRQFEIQDEKFDPINIDSNAQIVGSLGTISQVTSSAADPINYILGTVFQKSSFRVETDEDQIEHFNYNNGVALTGWASINDINFEVEVEPTKTGTTYSTFLDYTANSSEVFNVRYFAGSLYFGFIVNGNSISIPLVPLSSSEFLSLNVFSIKNSIIYIDGVQKADLSAYTTPFDNTTEKRLKIGMYENSLSNTYALNGFYKSFRVNAEVFNLDTGVGSIVKGSEGTDFEILTSAADSNERINFGMWQKNGNVLRLQPSSSDYIDCSNVSSWATLGDIDLSYTFNLRDITSPSPISILSRSIGATDRIELFVLNGQFAWRVSVGGTSVSSYTSSGLDLSKKTTFSYVGAKAFVNGTEVLDDNASSGTALFSQNLFYLNQQTFSGISGMNINIVKFEFNGKNFLFREGNGETTTSEDGTTTAEIKTSAADSENYINEFVWNEDSGKWIDYKKV